MAARKLFYTRRGNKYFKDRVMNWIEQCNNDALVPIVRNADPKELIDSNGLSILHIAAKCNNVTVIQTLINLGCEIDIVNSYGKTALMIAVSLKNVETMELLISANANLFITDRVGKSPLELFFEKKFFCSYILQFILEKMINILDNDREIIEKLIEAGCNLWHIMHLRDAEITKWFLTVQPVIPLEIQESVILAAMEYFDDENVKVFLNFGDGLNERLMTFLRVFSNLLRSLPCSENLLEVIRYFCRVVSEWKILNGNTVCNLGAIMTNIPEKSVHLVLQSEIRSYVKKYFKYDLLLYVFGNSDPKIIEWVQSQPFDIHSTTTYKETALHIAVKSYVVENIKYLLKIGMDPNVKDNYKRSAIFYICYTQNDRLDDRDEGAKFVLLHGADLLAEDFVENTAIENCPLDPISLDEFNQYVPCVFAHFAILEAQKMPFNFFVKKYIDMVKANFDFYEKYCKQLELLKVKKFSEQLTLFDVLTVNIEEICRHVDVEHSFGLDEIINEKEFNQYYIFVLKNRIKKAMLMKKLRIKAINSIGNSIPALKPYYPILLKIVCYLGNDIFRMFI